MLSKRVSRFEQLATKTTGNGYPSDMVGLDMALNVGHVSLLSTNFAFSCFSVTYFVSFFTQRHHGLHLLVQTFHIGAISGVIYESKSLFICCFFKSVFK